MQGEHSNQNSFFGIIYEDLVPADHFLRKLAAAVDFGFVSHLVSDCYCLDNGRSSRDPLVLFSASPPARRRQEGRSWRRMLLIRFEYIRNHYR